MRISRIRLSNGLHIKACWPIPTGSPQQDCGDAGALARGPCTVTPGLDVELPLKPLELAEFLGLTANLLSSAPSEAHPHRDPSLHRHYPASSVIWTPPTPTSAHPLPGQLRVSDSLTSMGLPCCDALFLYVPSPLPRRVIRSLGGCLRSGHGGLLHVRGGSALATAFRGLLRVHACYGPQICWPSRRGLLSGWLDDPGYPKAVHP